MRYYVVVSYSGLNEARDRKIEKAIGRKASGSGFSLLDGRRDVTFWFGRMSTVKKALERLKDSKVRVKVSVYDEVLNKEITK